MQKTHTRNGRSAIIFNGGLWTLPLTIVQYWVIAMMVFPEHTLRCPYPVTEPSHPASKWKNNQILCHPLFAHRRSTPIIKLIGEQSHTLRPNSANICFRVMCHHVMLIDSQIFNFWHGWDRKTDVQTHDDDKLVSLSNYGTYVIIAISSLTMLIQWGLQDLMQTRGDSVYRFVCMANR